MQPGLPQLHRPVRQRANHVESHRSELCECGRDNDALSGDREHPRTVTILDGVVAGRSVTSGVPPPVPPGYFFEAEGDGVYHLLAVPPGTYTLRVTRDGFAPMTKTATVDYLGGPEVDFPLVPITSQ